LPITGVSYGSHTSDSIEKHPVIQNPNSQQSEISLCLANFPCGEAAGVTGYRFPARLASDSHL
jgi:hypothetical protein